MYKTVNSILTIEAMPDTHSLMSSQSQREKKMRRNICLIHYELTNLLFTYLHQ